MEDKRTALAVLLCMFVLMFWMEMFIAPNNRRSAETNPQQQQQTAPTQNIQQYSNTASSNPASVAPAQTMKVPNAAEIKEAGFVDIDTPLYRMQISNLGGRIASFQLKHYKAFKGSENLLDLVLVNESQLPLGVYAGNLNDGFVKYKLEKTEGNPNSAPFTLHFSGKLTEAITINKTFVLNPEPYLLKLNVSLSSAPAEGGPVWLEWPRFTANLESNAKLNHETFTVLGADNKVKHMELTTVTQPIVEVGPSQWISFGDRYFMATLISPSGNAFSRVGKEGSTYYSRISGPSDKGDFGIFLGPKNHDVLTSAGYQLTRNVDLGMFAFIAHPLLACLNFFYSILGNYGLSIILLTLVIKFLFLPLTKTSYKSMSAMQKLQPEMKALRERIQDPTQLNQEMMALYKKHGVNPMGGCFPMLIQLPVFLGLYNALNNSIELRHAPFALWINDLSSIERLEVWGIGIPVMVLLMGLSMFIQQWTTPSSADPQQKKIMMMMPIIFTISFVIFPFPSGLVLYWLTNNLISIIQQMYLRGDRKTGALNGTILASILIFFAGYVLTLI